MPWPNGDWRNLVLPALTKRAKVEEMLTQSAIAEFLRKAESATKGFKGASYSVLEGKDQPVIIDRNRKVVHVW